MSVRGWLLGAAGVGAAISLLVWAGGGPRARASTPQTARRVRLIGDSQACLVGQLPGPHTTFLHGTTAAGEVDCRWGSRIADWNARVDEIPVAPGDLVLVFLGSNEMDATPDPRPIVASLRRRGADVVWVGPPLIRGASGAFIPHVQSLLAHAGVPYFDSRSLALRQDAAEVHPADEVEAARWLDAVLHFAGARP